MGPETAGPARKPSGHLPSPEDGPRPCMASHWPPKGGSLRRATPHGTGWKGALLMSEANRYPFTSCSAGVRVAAAQSRTPLPRAIEVPKWNPCVYLDLLPCDDLSSPGIEISERRASVFLNIYEGREGQCRVSIKTDCVANWGQACARLKSGRQQLEQQL
jgi:hypothetical protein